MPQVQHLDYAFVIVDLVIDQNRAVSQFAHTRSLPDCLTHSREISQEVYVVEQRLTGFRLELCAR